MPDGQNQGPDVASKASTADSAAREPIFESLDAAPAAPGVGEDVAGLFSPGAGFAGDASLDGAGPGQTMPIAGELWP